MGDTENEAYIPQTDQWRKEKLGEDYKFNDRLEFMSVPDRGLHLLMSHGIQFSKNEWLAIKLHDGLYDDANKPYLMSWNPETKPRTSLIYIIHQADLLAARIEFEKEWLPKLKGNLPPAEKNFTLGNKSQPKKTSTKTKALGSVKSEGLKNVMDDFFKD
jgi:glycosyltransferase involved in cell wall biosynthesis